MKPQRSTFLMGILLMFSIGFHTLIAQQIISFQNKRGITQQAQIDPKTGSAKRILGNSGHIHQYGFTKRTMTAQAVEALGRQLIGDYASVLKVTPAEVKLKKADTDGEWWFVDYEQTVAGIPVYDSEIGFSIDPQGNIVTLGARAHPRAEITSGPRIPAARALEAAKQRFQLDSVVVLLQPELTILPIDKDTAYTYSLMWKVQLLSIQPVKNITYFISATDGRVLSEIDNVRHNSIYGTVRGGYWPVRSTDNPVTTAFATTNVSLTSFQGQVWRVNTNSNGYYQFSGLSYAYYRVGIPLENLWIQVRDNGGSYGTHGALVEASYTVTPGQRDHDWGAWDGTNVFWHGRVVHDFFQGAPFNYTGMDYRMHAYVNSGPYVNGQADGERIFFGSDRNRPWARSSDVVYHEYTHNTIYRNYGGWIGYPNYQSQGAAMDEGLSDYFACTINNDPIFGEDVGIIDRSLSNSLRYPQNYDSISVMPQHLNGRIIGGAAWDVRQSTSVTIGDNLAFKGMQITPRARNFSDYLFNILIADNSNYSATHHSQIRTSFGNHGITAPVLSVMISGPSYLGWKQRGTWTANVSGGTGNVTYQWYITFSGGSYWDALGTAQQQSYTMLNQDFTLRCDLHDNGTGENATSSYNVFYELLPQPAISLESDLVKEGAALPIGFELSQNYPNPFNPETEITFALPEPSTVKLTVLDVLGREIVMLSNAERSAGYHRIRWNGSDAGGKKVGSGIYLYRLTATGESGKQFTKVMKMAMIK